MNWEAYANHVIELLAKDGPAAVDAVKNGLKAVSALTGKDFASLFVALDAGWTDVTKIVADVKSAFGLQ